jgi:glucose-1-phosphate adenylyltransferase
MYASFLNHDFDYALILSGDQLYQMDFNEMIEEHIKSKPISPLPPYQLMQRMPQFGILKQMRRVVESFIEKPAKELLPDGSQM